MNYENILSTLYFLLIHADGNVNNKEVAACNQMIKAEGFSKDDFERILDRLKMKDQASLLPECMIHMRKLTKQQQIRIIAWLCVLANADGFMERSEWQLIYQVYHKELNLPLNEIFDVQKELTKLVWLKSLTAPE